MVGSSESWGLPNRTRLAARAEMMLGRIGNCKGTQNSEEEEESKKVIEVCPVSRQFYDLDDDLETDVVQGMRCPDPEFYDFEKDRADDCLDVDQIWAMYDETDAMPRYYGRVRKVFKEKSMLMISWLEASPVTEVEQDWHDRELPISCGRFEIGEDGVVGRLSLSHRMHTRQEKDTHLIYPNKGETWAIFKNWDMKPELHKPPYSYDLVDILTDFSEEVGVRVGVLNKVEGFVSIFRRGSHDMDMDISFCVWPTEVLRFSHRVPSRRMTGREREGVPAGSFELDTAALPSNLFNDRVVDGRAEKGLASKETARSSANCRVELTKTSIHAKEKTILKPGTTLVDSRKKLTDNPNSSKTVDITGKLKKQLLTGQDTFWTCCPFCKVKFQHYSRFQDGTMRCQNCRQNFVAYDAGPVGQESSDVQVKRKRIDNLNSSTFVDNESAAKLRAAGKGDYQSQTSDSLCHSKKPRSEDELSMGQAELPKLKERIKTCKTELQRTRVSIQERQGELHSIEEKIKEINSRHDDCVTKQEAELATLNERIKERKKELEKTELSLQEGQRQRLVRDCDLQSIEESIKEANSKFEERKKQYNLLKKSVSECKVDLRSKQSQLKGLKRSIQECTMKEKALSYVREEVRECCQTLEWKEKELDDIKKSMEATNLVLEVRVKQLNEVKSKLEHNCGKLKAMDEHQHRIKKTIMELRRKREYYQSVEKPSQELSAVMFMKDQNTKLSVAGKARELQLLLDKHTRNHDLLQKEVSTLIKSSTEPAKLVLEAMNGFYPPDAENKSMDYELSITRRSCINLLEHLLKLGPPIMSEVREAAMKLAMKWKAIIMMSKAATSLEVLGFLQLVSAFGLAPGFGPGEVKQLLLSGLPRQGNGSETWRSLGIMDDLTEEKPDDQKLLQASS